MATRTTATRTAVRIEPGSGRTGFEGAATDGGGAAGLVCERESPRSAAAAARFGDGLAIACPPGTPGRAPSPFPEGFEAFRAARAEPSLPEEVPQ